MTAVSTLLLSKENRASRRSTLPHLGVKDHHIVVQRLDDCALICGKLLLVVRPDAHAHSAKCNMRDVRGFQWETGRAAVA